MRPVLHLIPLALLLGAAACGSERSPGNGDDRAPPAARAIDAGEAGAVRSLLSRGLGEEALGRARRLQAEHPQAADAHLLVGDALGTRGDFAGVVLVDIDDDVTVAGVRQGEDVVGAADE